MKGLERALHPGMSPQEVEIALGQPIVDQSYDPNRYHMPGQEWDRFYILDGGKAEATFEGQRNQLVRWQVVPDREVRIAAEGPPSRGNAIAFRDAIQVDGNQKDLREHVGEPDKVQSEGGPGRMSSDIWYYRCGDGVVQIVFNYGGTIDHVNIL